MRKTVVFKVKHYMLVEGEKVEIDPLKTDLPDHCRLVWAEMMTGQKHAFEDSDMD